MDLTIAFPAAVGTSEITAGRGPTGLSWTLESTAEQCGPLHREPGGRGSELSIARYLADQPPASW